MAVLDLNEDFDDLGLEILDLIDVLTVEDKHAGPCAGPIHWGHELTAGWADVPRPSLWVGRRASP